MGCCSSCQKPQEEDEFDERSPLIGNKKSTIVSDEPTRNSLERSSTGSEKCSSSFKTSHQAVKTESDRLSKIIQNLEKDVIDITAIETKVSTQEFTERALAYEKKMKESFKFQAPTTKVLKSASKNPLLSLSRPPISQKRLIHISKHAEIIEDAFERIQSGEVFQDESNKNLLLDIC